MAQYLLSPSRLQQFAADMPGEDQLQPTPVAATPDPGLMLEQALALLSYAERRITAQRERIAHLESLALIDELTGLPNRRAFENALYATLATARRHQDRGLLAYLDIDNFRTVNETLGREAGNQVLVRIAELLASQVRASDTVARFGGDEFVALLCRIDPAAAEARIRQIQQLLNTSPASYDGTHIHVRTSLGVVAYGPDDVPAVLLQRADAAMLNDRRSRRGRVGGGN